MGAPLTRRAALAASCAACAATVLGACSTYGGTPDDSAAGNGAAGTGTPDEPGAAAEGTTAPPAPAEEGEATPALAKAGDIPVKGGKIFAEQQVVITQPQAGTFKAFSTTCTHQGCAVTEVDDTINCTCHGSRFNLDGTVAGGPAPRPLPPVRIAVNGDSITLA